MEDDAALLLAWADGDADSGERLYRRHFASVYRFFRSKSDDAVDDLVQDTFMVALRRAPKFRGGSVRAFLLGIARYELLEWIRQRAKHDARIDPASQSLRDMGTGVSTAVGRNEREAKVRAALEELPLDMQLAIELRYWHGLSMAEIGEVQSVATTTVRTRLHRARKALREHLEESLLQAVGLSSVEEEALPAEL